MTAPVPSTPVPPLRLTDVLWGAAILALFGLAVIGERVISTWHWHVCDVCRHRWGHSAYLAAGNDKAHKCKKCGALSLFVAHEHLLVHHRPMTIQLDGGDDSGKP